MSRYSGDGRDHYGAPDERFYGKGAARRVRELKHLEADERNAVTPNERRKAYRRTVAAVRTQLERTTA